MRLQHVSVMFVIIFIPIILVTSYFISLEVNTVRLESDLDKKLLDATYDAMTAFELNTANEDLSSVSDSLRSIIDASNNVFFNTLCTNLGVSNASKSYIQPYIPAILYTLYDGYYIYSPTNIPEICVDTYGHTLRTSSFGVSKAGETTVNGIKIGLYTYNEGTVIFEDATKEPKDGPKIDYNSLGALKEEYDQILYKNNNGTYSVKLHSSTDWGNSTYYKRDYILKSYVPYTARYESGGVNVRINYTLDNYMTIEGTIGGAYYTKSGYFTAQNLVKSIKVKEIATNTEVTIDWKSYSEETIDNYIHDPAKWEVTVEVEGNGTNNVIFSNRTGVISGSGTLTQYWDDAQDAVEYYVDSYLFSSWVRQYLSGIKVSDLKNDSYSVTDVQKALAESVEESSTGERLRTDALNQLFYVFSGDNSNPFGASVDPEDEEGVFYSHKRNVIKNSINYNMILSMLVYTEESRTVEFNMPVLRETEWDRILNHVSITAFMEGIRCGMKYYNNYAIVTSTNNEISVTENEIYYVPRNIVTDIDGKLMVQPIDDKQYVKDGGEILTAHRIDCPDLELTANGALSFKSKEIKYDKILTKTGEAEYDHMVYTDYNCIVDSNYSVKDASGNPVIYTDGSILDGNTDALWFLRKYSSQSGGEFETNNWWKLFAYRIAIAKERNNLYKTTAFPESYGWNTAYAVSRLKDGKEKKYEPYVEVDLSLCRSDLNEIKKIEVVIEDTKILASDNTTPIYGVYTDTIEARFVTSSGEIAYPEKQTVATTSGSRRTLEFYYDFNRNPSVSATGKLRLYTGRRETRFVVEAVKVYYK